MVSAETLRLQNLISNIEAQIKQLQPTLTNLLSPRIGLKIEVSTARKLQAQILEQNIQGLKESLIDLKQQLLEEQLKPDIKIEELIINGGIIQESPIVVQVIETPLIGQPLETNNSLRNALLLGGVLLIL